ncbi:serine hydrolase [Lutibacter sp. HS1-25]|uniref:class A beta-lactamase n=1 Tax=Lutibacter sp. HS1-25 TaxID=2485000 RepID=UPI0010114873|nr:class A beta-lactamase [Lutibacter sp. HS1-25]RXP59445.1 serine hydrolase [Lutibacter sp. HS1-25]
MKSNNKTQTVLADKSISEKIEKISNGLVGRIGAAAQDLSTGLTVSINGDEPFVMASTYKVAIAVTIFRQVDEGKLKLTDLVDCPSEKMVPGPNPLVTYLFHPGVKLSIANLLEPMITDSDNSATDFLLEVAGGPQVVTDMLRSIGITDFRVDRYVSEILRDFYGLEEKAYLPYTLKAYAKDPTLLTRQGDRNLKFEQEDPRDHTTPNAMLQLLLAIDNGTALSEKSREVLLGMMSRTTTGFHRLRGLLPKGTPVADKTGTIGGVANDVGFITLPDGRRIAIAVYTKSSTTSEADREKAIAEVTRSIYDFFYLQS